MNRLTDLSICLCLSVCLCLSLSIDTVTSCLSFSLEYIFKEPFCTNQGMTIYCLKKIVCSWNVFSLTGMNILACSIFPFSLICCSLASRSSLTVMCTSMHGSVFKVLFWPPAK